VVGAVKTTKIAISKTIGKHGVVGDKKVPIERRGVLESESAREEKSAGLLLSINPVPLACGLIL
jgi:hypothetical protein